MPGEMGQGCLWEASLSHGYSAVGPSSFVALLNEVIHNEDITDLCRIVRGVKF